MPEHQVQFLTFDHAVAAAINEPGAEFVGLKFVEPFSHLGVYVINVYADEPGNVNVFYEGDNISPHPAGKTLLPPFSRTRRTRSVHASTLRRSRSISLHNTKSFCAAVQTDKAYGRAIAHKL